MSTGTCDWCGGSFEDRSPGQNRRFCTDNCRKRAHDDTTRRGVCDRCGGLMSANSLGRYVRCWDCRKDRVRRHDRAKRIEQWWAKGLTVSVIADRLGWTKDYVGVEIAQLRGRGYDIPHRRSPETVKRITDGWARSRHEAAA